MSRDWRKMSSPWQTGSMPRISRAVCIATSVSHRAPPRRVGTNSKFPFEEIPVAGLPLAQFEFSFEGHPADLFGPCEAIFRHMLTSQDLLATIREYGWYWRYCAEAFSWSMIQPPTSPRCLLSPLLSGISQRLTRPLLLPSLANTRRAQALNKLYFRPISGLTWLSRGRFDTCCASGPNAGRDDRFRGPGSSVAGAGLKPFTPGLDHSSHEGPSTTKWQWSTLSQEWGRTSERRYARGEARHRQNRPQKV
ncbi:hypothetical protein B0T14DRAFT_307403 [Immersiella caudata]|uniref:Uncharacterized protein n=1 Tax=Immersiella caudata TaxID=314043 RepID=A0AA40BUP5_9PEZI|nr:hypothetical protein B0T14DRAFT_307403 [Immersiella caudata]